MNELLRRLGSFMSGRERVGRMGCSACAAEISFGLGREVRLLRFVKCKNDECSSGLFLSRDLVLEAGDSGIREASAMPKPSSGTWMGAGGSSFC